MKKVLNFSKKNMMLAQKQLKASDFTLEEKVIAINRVTKVVEGGHNFSSAAVVMVGNGEGVVGYGLDKAKELLDAIAKEVEAAKRQLIRVPILRGTLPHEAL